MENKERTTAEVRFVDALGRILLLTKEGNTALVHGYTGTVSIGSEVKLVRDEGKRRMTDWSIEP